MFYCLVLAPLLILPITLLLIRLMYKFTSGSYQINQSLRGKVFLITGATSGIGLEAARELYLHGGTVVMLCRDMNKAHLSSSKITSLCTDGHVDTVECDVSSLDSVRKCAEKVLHKYPKINVLINNAGEGGVSGCRRITPDGLEVTMATNYFGHFLLTMLLLNRLKSTGAARVINVSSLMHWFCRDFTVDSLNFEHNRYTALRAYCQSKLAQVLFTKQLATLVRPEGVFIVHRR